MTRVLTALLLAAALSAEDAPKPPTPLLLEIRQVERMKRGMNTEEKLLFTLQTLVTPGSPIHLRAIQKGQAIHLEGALGTEEKDGFLLALKGTAVEEMKTPPPGLAGPVFDAKELQIEKRTVPGREELLGEVKDTNDVYRLSTYAVLKTPGKEMDPIEALGRHAK